MTSACWCLVLVELCTVISFLPLVSDSTLIAFLLLCGDAFYSVTVLRCQLVYGAMSMTLWSNNVLDPIISKK